MTAHVNTKEKTHKLFELIEYYEICNKAEGKSPKTISWYSANLKSFRNYLKNRHLPDSLDNIDTKLLREYVLYLLKKTRYENHPYTPAKPELLSTATVHGHVRTLHASFNGIHNASKTKALIILDHYKYKLGLSTGLNVRQLHSESGVNYDYLRSRLGKWFKWKYVSRRAHDDGTGRPMFYYTIAARGEHFINHIVPNDVLARYITEINQYRTNKKTHK